ncbi:MAG: hypothetical protein WBE32_15640 [Pseudolabrys sp.]
MARILPNLGKSMALGDHWQVTVLRQQPGRPVSPAQDVLKD